jgi:Fe-S-cluster containining protein
MTKRNSCKGHCCTAFNLPFSPSEIARLSTKRFGPDALKVRDMLIYLGKRVGNPIVEQDGLSETKPHHWYTCKWFDGETRSCLNYEDRPEMCSSFPNRQPTCPYAGCQHFNGAVRAETIAFRKLRSLCVVAEKHELTAEPTCLELVKEQSDQ